MKKIGIVFPGAAATMVLAGLVGLMAQTPGSSPLSPAPIGTVVAGIVECGQGYTSHELYDMKLTVFEVIRGEEAWKRLREASASNKPADAGQEYVIARVRFEYRARGTPGSCIHQVAPEQFTAFSAEGVDYKNPGIVAPKPEMRKALRSGESVEGWVVFMVAEQDRTPLMAYSADVGGAVMHGGVKWFRLY